MRAKFQMPGSELEMKLIDDSIREEQLLQCTWHTASGAERAMAYSQATQVGQIGIVIQQSGFLDN